MIYQAMCTSFKVGLLNGDFDFGTGTSQVFNVALYTSAANLSAATTAYSSTNEASGAGYSPGGTPLSVSVVPTSTGTTAFLSFSDVIWPATTITARGALIYKADGVTNPAIAVIDFGEDKQTNAGNFTIKFPLANAANAIISIA
jgi:hypothetical protein